LIFNSATKIKTEDNLAFLHYYCSFCWYPGKNGKKNSSLQIELVIIKSCSVSRFYLVKNSYKAKISFAIDKD